MAQQGRRKQAPAYSADTMALRYIAGLALAALGVMIFMAVDLNMSGNIFQGLRQVCFGVSGSLAYVLAALPLWAGGLVIWSTQRRAPVRPWIFALLSFIGICTFIMLISGNAMESLNRLTGGSWGGVIGRVYTDCITKVQGGQQALGGGALGAMIAWPLWRYLGTVLGVVIIFPATLLCILMIFNLTPVRIKDIITGQAGERRAQQDAERVRAEQQQMAWQQQQAMQQQAWQQQQAYILEEQYRQQQAAAQQAAAQQAMPQNTARPDAQYTVEQWQDQLTTQQTAAAAPDHKSRIFGQRNPGAEPKKNRSWKSRIFGQKEEEYDGLVGGDPAEQDAEPRRNERLTATGQVARSETKWNLSGETAETRPRTAQTARPAQPVRPAQQAQAMPAVQPVKTAQNAPEERRTGTGHGRGTGRFRAAGRPHPQAVRQRRGGCDAAAGEAQGSRDPDGDQQGDLRAGAEAEAQREGAGDAGGRRMDPDPL